MSSIECIVLDFDGTFTRVDEEAVPFVQAFQRELAAEIGVEIGESWKQAATRIESEPARYGWEYDGTIVAPSHADPYIRCTAIGQLILDEAGVVPVRRTEILQSLYRRCYPLSLTLFRPEAKTVVETIIASGLPVFVVTNSATDHVQAKINALDPVGKEAIRVRGDARKYVLHEPEKSSPMFGSLPEKAEIAGLPRPIFLRRGYYFEALRRIWDETRTGPESTVVCGDIFELDLAMPARLGTRVHLVTRPSTPDYERRAVRGIPGGSTSADLAGLLNELDLPG
jgi:phosphoglycolate phosphatase-like HAD superfamily hydrolase